MTIELIPLCTIDVRLADPIFVGSGPSGIRAIGEVTGLDVKGERLSGKQRGNASADWILINGTVATIDVRATIETHDGAIVFAQYQGRGDFSNGADGAIVYVAPRFETGDERYAWLNTVQAIGKGVLNGHELTYEWYEVR